MVSDIFDQKLVCNNCNGETKKLKIDRNGFIIRGWHCTKCKKKWEHPGDVAEYDSFNKIKNKNFRVKLRLVGNSYAVSIPREIINFLEEFNEIENKFIDLSLDEPEKLTLFFKEVTRKFY